MRQGGERGEKLRGARAQAVETSHVCEWIFCAVVVLRGEAEQVLAKDECEDLSGLLPSSDRQERKFPFVGQHCLSPVLSPSLLWGCSSC